jgi:hypothetical protein
MLRRFFHSQFFSKVFYELLPATIASAIGAYFINSYIKTPDAPPQPAASTAASLELVQLMRDQQALLSDYLQKSAEARQRADLAMAQEADRLKAAEREAVQAWHEAKAAEMRALAAAVRAAETPERRLAAKSPVTTPASQPDKAQIEKVTTGEPLQLHQAASAAPPPQPQPQVSPQPAPATAAAAPSHDNGAMATLRGAVSGIVRLPFRVSDWLTDAVPPRPPTDLPQRNFMKAAM